MTNIIYNKDSADNAVVVGVKTARAAIEEDVEEEVEGEEAEGAEGEAAAGTSTEEKPAEEKPAENSQDN